MSEASVIITAIKVKPEKSALFSTWQEKMNAAAAAFPGFVSLEMVSPKEEKDSWRSIQKFQGAEELNNWRISEVRQSLLDELKPLLMEEEEPIKEYLSEESYNIKGVTEVFVTSVKPGMQEFYKKWATKIQKVESQFPGYLGVYIQAPGKDVGSNWITILSFDTAEHLNNWLSSEERKNILKEAEEAVEELQSHRVESPFAGWFASLSKEGEPPPVWKQTMLVLLVLYPIVMLEILFLNPWTKNLMTPTATFIGNAISVSLVSWPLMPIAIYFLNWWLIPKTKRDNKKEILGVITVFVLYLIEILAFKYFS